MPGTLTELFQRAAAEHAQCAALQHKVDGEYRSITYAALARRVMRFARGLAALGVEAGDRVAIIAENRPEWAVADLATLALGAINVPLFTSLSPAQIRYILDHSGARLVIVSNASLLRTVLQATSDDVDVRVVVMDPPASLPDGAVAFDAVLELADGSPLTEESYHAAWVQVVPDQLASIVYTSGTTGEPKGVMLTHANFVSNVRAAHEVLRFTRRDVLVSFLPLSHVLERMAAYYLALSWGACVAYSEGPRHLRDNILEVRPTMMLLVPRVYEVFQEGIEARMAKLEGLPRRLYEWSFRVGRARATALNEGRIPSLGVAVQWAVAKLLFIRKLHAAMGLDRLRYFVCGGAALPPETAWFMLSLGLNILEGYGLTESSPVISVNRPKQFRIGTVGLPLKGVEVRISEAGEILARGPMSCAGTTAGPRTPLRRSTPTAGSTPATWDPWTSTASSASPIGSRASSSSLTGRTSRLSPSRTRSRPARTSPKRSSWATAGPPWAPSSCRLSTRCVAGPRDAGWRSPTATAPSPPARTSGSSCGRRSTD
ncbi:MAG: AMP-binding protein [Acidobacteriota bacterium]|jgi:long-chain acyl-CoA synthetase|nr:AMP-binding protein [Acidobacteriota bacterium]